VCPQVAELTGDNAFTEHCKGGTTGDPKQLCFIAFLPDILDTKASGRNAYIVILQKMAEAFKERPYSYMWAAGGAHGSLEAAVDVGGFGYPALVALSPKKEVYDAHHVLHSSPHVDGVVLSVIIRNMAQIALKTAASLSCHATCVLSPLLLLWLRPYY
jgi:hypothetical protein